MDHFHLYKKMSFFVPNRLVFQAPETAPSERNHLISAIRDLEDSDYAETLRFMLRELIEHDYSEYADALKGQSIGELLEGIWEVGGFDSSDPPSEIVQDIFTQAFDVNFPNGRDQETQELFDYVLDTLPRVPTKSQRSSAEVKKKGSELIDESASRITSPKLEELRTRLSHLVDAYNERLGVTNKAAIQVMAREAALIRLMESQGFQLDPTEQADNFFRLTGQYNEPSGDFKLLVGNETRQRSQVELDAAKNAESFWSSMAYHFRRSNVLAERYEKQIGIIEAQIKTEEEKAKRG